jgi:hypothetical protein
VGGEQGEEAYQVLGDHCTYQEGVASHDHLVAFQGEEDLPCPEVEEVLSSFGEEVPSSAHKFLEVAYLVLPVVHRVELPFAPSVMVLLAVVAFPDVVPIEEEHQVPALVGEVLQTGCLVVGDQEEPALVEEDHRTDYLEEGGLEV